MLSFSEISTLSFYTKVGKTSFKSIQKNLYNISSSCFLMSLLQEGNGR